MPFENTYRGVCFTFQLFLGRGCSSGTCVENEKYQKSIDEICKTSLNEFQLGIPGMVILSNTFW